MTDRGERRAQKERNLNRWRRIMRRWFRGVPNETAARERSARLAAAHGVLCSCWMCGNPRKTEGDTMQERRANDIAASQDI